MKVSKLSIIIICSLIFMIGSVFFFNYVIKKDKENKALEEQKEEHKPIDLSDASNVPVIDGKLGDDIVITQGYLMRYVTKKRSIWYQSSGYVQDITSKNGQSVIKISDSLSSKEYILLTIDSDKCTVKKKDFVYFVGTVEVGSKNIILSKISKDEFSYSSATKILISELINNLTLLEKNNFVISGFLVTEEKEYKLFDSKEDYQNNGRYFLVKWKNKFDYTGNQKIYVTCKLDTNYNLKDCIYNE